MVALGNNQKNLKSPGFTARSLFEDEHTAGQVHHNTLQLYIEASEGGYLYFAAFTVLNQGKHQQPPSSYHITTIYAIANQNYSPYHEEAEDISIITISHLRTIWLYTILNLERTTIFVRYHNHLFIAYQYHTTRKLRTSPSSPIWTMRPSHYVPSWILKGSNRCHHNPNQRHRAQEDP